MSAEEIKRKISELFKRFDEVVAENNSILGDTLEERETTRAALRGLAPKQLREAVSNYKAKRSIK